MKWYQKTWVIILFLIIFWPVGLFFMWKSNWSKIAKIVITAFIAMIVFVGCIGGSSNSNSTNTNQNKKEVKVDTSKEDKKKEEEAKADTSKEDEEKKEEVKIDTSKKDEENISIEYKNALKKAQMYSDSMSMSKVGLYNQLTSEYGEKFPAEAAQYAIDNVNADWNNNALQKAKSYQEEMAMSKDAIYDQLTSEYGEGFTPEEAQYAIDNLE